MSAVNNRSVYQFFQNIAIKLGPEISLSKTINPKWKLGPSLPSLIKEPPSGNQPILNLANLPDYQFTAQ